MRFNRSVTQNMLNLKFITKFPANQNRAVTFERILFSTHQGQPISLSAFPQPRQSFLKGAQLGNAIISSNPLDVTFLLRPASPQFIAEEYVSNSILREKSFQRGPIKVWRPPAKRIRSHITHSINLMPLQKIQKFFPAVP